MPDGTAAGGMAADGRSYPFPESGRAGGGRVGKSESFLDTAAIVRGTAASLVLSLALSLVLAGAVRWTGLTDQHFHVALYYGGFLSILGGAAWAGHMADRRGWLHGGFVGLAAMTVSLALTAAGMPGVLTAADVTLQALLAFLVGCLGGVIGVNLA